MTSVADFFAPDLDERQKVKRDRWGRYLLPHPETGQEQSWTRATTMAKACSETYALERWAKRMVGVGVALREDFQIALLAASDNEELDRVIELAKEHAGGSIGSRHGTAMHALSERVDRGETVVVPPAVEADLNAYREAIKPFVIEAIERIVIQPSLNVAGTLDRIVRLPDGRLMVLDLKTGADLSYAWCDIAAQLHLYASAPLMWNPESGGYEPMPAVDQAQALVLHLPKGERRAQLYTVDLVRGAEIVYLCTEVRRIRALRDLAAEVTIDQLATPAVSAPQPDTQAEPAAPAGGVATPSPSGAGADVVPLRASDIRWPLNPAGDSGFRATPRDVEALMTLVRESPAEAVERMKAWAAEARQAGRGFDAPPLTQRMWTVMRAALFCALHCFDWQVTLGLGRVLGTEVPDNWSLGATLGSLDEGQADQLATLVMSGELDPF